MGNIFVFILIIIIQIIRNYHRYILCYLGNLTLSSLNNFGLANHTCSCSQSQCVESTPLSLPGARLVSQYYPIIISLKIIGHNNNDIYIVYNNQPKLSMPNLIFVKNRYAILFMWAAKTPLI